MLLDLILGMLAGLSLLLLLWQWLAAIRFPLHRRDSKAANLLPVSILKPLKGCDETTEKCLLSWLTQDYPAATEVLIGVESAADPVCPMVERLIAAHPKVRARLIFCAPLSGPNLKVSKLAHLAQHSTHDHLVISDADVWAPPDCLREVIARVTPGVGLVNCFYRLANPSTAAMHWEAVAVNADFWSQVLQSKSLRPLDFALGAVMAVRREDLNRIGGFKALETCLADDYQLGHRIANTGGKIELSPMVVECWSPPTNWSQVWEHQLRWARTIRVCQPVPYFFSILSNPTFWPLLWLAAVPTPASACLLAAALVLRWGAAWSLLGKMDQQAPPPIQIVLAPLKDLLQAGLWVGAYAGNTVEWRGSRYHLHSDGRLTSAS